MQREFKLFAWFALALGCAGILLGLGALLGGPLHESSGTGCKAICGLSLLLRELLGESAGAWLKGLLLLAAGLGFAWLGLRVLKDQSA